MIGSALVTGCQALIDALQADEVLARDGVKISYAAPVVPEDLKATDGAYEAIWLGDAELEYEIPILTAGHLYRDETADQQVVIQVLVPSTAGTQQAVDLRVQEIEARLETVLANSVDLGVTDPARFEAVLTGSRFVRGRLGNTQGHGARIEAVVQFTARLSPT